MDGSYYLDEPNALSELKSKILRIKIFMIALSQLLQIVIHEYFYNNKFSAITYQISKN